VELFSFLSVDLVWQILDLTHHLRGRTINGTSRLYPAVKILKKDLGRKGKLSVPFFGGCIEVGQKK
jgi:hypothetical protein